MRPATVAVIGGGILGASTAYHLAVHGLRDIVLMERLDIANAASSRAAGLLLQISSKPAMDRLFRETFSVIEALEAELGESLDFRRVGTLRFAETGKSRSAVASLLTRARKESLAAERVDPSWCAAALPWLSTGPETLSVFFPGEGFIDAYRLTTAYTKAATRRGVRVETGMAVDSICLEDGRVAGIETSVGVQPCEALVVAAGAWSNNLTLPLGVSLPMVPTRSQFWVSAPEDIFAGNQPMTIHSDARSFTRPEVGGILIGLQESRSPTFDCRMLPEDIGAFAATEDGGQWDTLIEGSSRLGSFFPAINDIRFESYMDGLSTYTPDGHFILGAIDSIPGLYVAGGCCGSGVMASCGIGDALADLIVNGKSRYDLSPFKPERFGCVDPSGREFQARCAAARAGKSK